MRKFFFMSEIIIKTAEQIEGIRQSSQLAGKALVMIAEHVKAGVNTEYLDKLIDEFIRDHGAIPATLGYSGYPKSCCISLNEVVCHGIPAPDIILKEGDILNIDVTTILNGYYGDTSKMFTVGEVSDKAAQIIQVAKHCLDLGIQQVRPGNQFGNIGFVIGRYAKAHKYSVVYEFCGHGVGLEFHEAPQVDHIARRNSGAVMQPGMTFTIEPMINEGKATTRVDKYDGWTARTSDGKLSAQFEHTVLVTEDGVEVLTDVTGEYNR
ncbi:type I methionyl aminopeptidase [Prolixibacteraceae bacterium A06]|uniref:Methionine aminopeptidase n=1 Tax=Gaoshiqia sediminis TaxID=2986998 RepID=A0AA41YDI2_9BACT|nr:type I methionyl aminopeptidase [Gaoshiqia sediminis]MCW0484705.1 type I methionyl aminopeptidase [Gaoshiqia sediminis]